ncbi:Por secretion system C-terminal sorting domain-containing protein [Flexibacter flexilis DSM 6793]|uniref:Por secretion system C-terminal sorting domain-containing protein n=1 Tax=Flexibacter flexilis DSM 6793 TaxID=927664 RepID=A0A1I1J4P1_9BACT|nr:T9SS type A sorting domain-containing protein [Flexibacter flexilis]SFC40913.1 Por secretion system C-terminal sorting domain-containing protein [Flexibacter flexilis DSM 6793]
MKNLLKTAILCLLFCHLSVVQAQPLQMGDWQKIKTPSIGGYVALGAIYKGNMYAYANDSNYISANQANTWSSYDPLYGYFYPARYLKQVGGRLVWVGGNQIKLKDYTTESWTDTLIPMTPNINNIRNWADVFLLHQDSVLAIGEMGTLHQDSLFILKADTITWQFKPITFNAPDNIKIKSPYSGKSTGNALYLSYAKPENSGFYGYRLVKSIDNGHNWLRVCMGSVSNFEILNNELYTINQLADSLTILRRVLPDTTTQVIGAGLHKKSLNGESKLYAHQNTLYLTGQDGVYKLNGLAWEKVGAWQPYTLGNISGLVFQQDTIWASTSRGLFRYDPQTLFWEARNNGINSADDRITLLDVQENKVLFSRTDNSKSLYALSEDNLQSSSFILEADWNYYSSYHLQDNDNILAYDKLLKHGYANGLAWDTDNLSLPPNQTSYGIVQKDPYVFISLGLGGLVYRSEDGGYSWTLKNTGKPTTDYGGNYLFLVNNILYQYRGWDLYRSTDNAETWIKCNFTNNVAEFSQAGPAHHGNEVFVALNYDSTYFHSVDNGLTWTKKTFPAYLHQGGAFNIGEQMYFIARSDYWQGYGKIYRYEGDINAAVFVADFPLVLQLQKAMSNDSLLFIKANDNVYYAAYEPMLPTGIRSPKYSSIAVNLYPNPAKQAFSLELPVATQEADIRILDMLGKEYLHHAHQGDNRLSISLKDMPAGMYLVRIQTDKGSTTQKLMVQQ